MKIEHLAIWTSKLEALTNFYVRYFGAVPGNLYLNPARQFRSKFLSFPDGPRLELMQGPGISSDSRGDSRIGLAHFAMSVGSKANVDALTETLRSAGHAVIGEPRWTGDGYYESVVLDPEQNRVEITI
jgi:lactoylglutathione lyase